MTQRTAVITGGGQGIGRAAAHRLTEQGYHAVLVGRTQAKLEAVVHEIRAGGGSAEAAVLDVSDSAQVQAFAETLGDRAVDVLVNSAGEALIKPLDHTTDADWDRILSINLKGPFLMCRALSGHLHRSGNATVINIGSKTSFGGYGDLSAYTAAKTGLVGLTRALAAEWKDAGVRVVLLAPGPADTPMRWATTPDADPETLIQPQSVADTIAWIAALPRGVVVGEVLVQSASYL